MKKILLASTALVMAGGMAAAQGLEITGSAEMGVSGSDGSVTLLDTDTNTLQRFDLDSDLGLHTDIDVNFSGTIVTDNGLTFGASIDLDESQNGDAFAPNTEGGEVIFVNSAFGNLTMGDTDGAFDWAMTEAIIGGTLNDDHEHLGYNGNSGLDGTYDGQIARYDNTFGGFGFAASVELDDTDTDGNDPVVGFGLSYDVNLGGADIALGLGYQTTALQDNIDDVIDGEDNNDDSDIIGISAQTEIAGFNVILNYTDLDGATIVAQEALDGTENDDFEVTADSHFGIAVGYDVDAFTVGFNYGRYDIDGGDIDGYGLAVGYDLGGGAELQFGYGHSEASDAFDQELDLDTYSFGVSMSF